jgi:hypothetical protein
MRAAVEGLWRMGKAGFAAAQSEYSFQSKPRMKKKAEPARIAAAIDPIDLLQHELKAFNRPIHFNLLEKTISGV